MGVLRKLFGALQAFLAAPGRMCTQVFQNPLSGLARLWVVGLDEVIIEPVPAFLPSHKSHKCPYDYMAVKCPRQGGYTNFTILDGVC